MTRSLLQLEDFWIARLDFRAKESQLPEDGGAEFLPRLTWNIDTSPDGRYEVKFRVSENSRRYHLLLDLTGLFSFSREANEETRERMVTTNGPSILYGIARGIVSGITGMSPTGRSAMPSVNIVAVNDRREKKKTHPATLHSE